MAYSAGTAWLQVMPSFRGIDRQLRQDVRRLGAEIDRQLGETIPRSMERSFDEGSRRAERFGRDAGNRYGDHFGRTMRRSLNRALDDLPPLQIGAARNHFDQTMRGIRADLEGVRDQVINMDIDDDTALAAIDRVHDRMVAAERDAAHERDAANLRSARAQLDGIRNLAEESRRSGHEAGGNFGGAFGREVNTTLNRALRDIPDIPLRPDSTPFDNAMRRIRRNLTELRNFRIGIDGDIDEFMRRYREVQIVIEKLRRANVNIQFNADLDRANATLRDFVSRVAPQMGRQAGDGLGGQFEDTVHRRLTAAFQSLPDIRIDADSTPAQIEIARIRQRIDELRNVHIGVDMDAAEVLAEVALLHRQLNALDRDDVDIQIRADAAAAIAQLAAVSAMANQVDGSVTNIGTAASASLGRLGALIAAGLSLGTVLVPAAAAAAVAISGIATAAGAAVAGIGVLVLGMSGVVGAITALNKYQLDVNKSAKSFAQSQTQIAGAVDGVANSERSLANARAQAAYQARQSARTVVDAQRSVTEAQKEARRAQLDLIEAIKEARQLDQDRALQLRGNALAQRQATLDIAEARAELDKVLSNPDASQAEREQARITFEQRTLQMDELRVQGQRLAEEQAKAAKEGVNGNEQVQAAQRRVEQTTQAVGDAQERVRDAIEAAANQQRSSAAAVEAAQQQVIASQRQLQQAFVNSSTAGGEAFDNLQDAMRTLSPEAQRFVRYLFSMKEAAIGLRQAAERGMLPGFQEALRELQPFLPPLTAFIFKVASGLGEIAVEAVQALGHPVWRQFFGYIDATAVPALKGMFQFSEAVARGLASLIMALSPFNRSMGQGLLDMAESFATWARELSDSSGFQKFLAYTAANGPRVVDLLLNLGKMIERIVIASAPIGSVVLRALNLLVQAINAIPIPILTLLLTVIGGLSVRLLANAAIIGIWTRSQALANNQHLLWQRVVALGSGIANTYTVAAGRAAVATSLLGRSMGVAAVAGAGIRGALSGFIGLLGGPWVAAITAATIGIGYLITRSHQAKQDVNELKQSFLGLGDTFKNGITPASIENAEALLRQDKKLRDLVTTTQRAGISTETLIRGLNGEAGARKEVLEALDREIEQLVAAEEAAKAFNARTGHRDTTKESEQIHKQVEALQALRGAFDATAGATADATSLSARFAKEQEEIAKNQTRAFTDAMQFVRLSLQQTAISADGYASILNRLGATSLDAASKSKVLEVIAGRISASQLTATQQAGLFNDVLGQLGNSAGTSGATFDALAGVFNTIGRSAISARDKVDLLKQAMDQMYGAAISQAEADENLVRTQSALTGQLQQNQYGFDLTAKSAKGHEQEVLANRDALEAALQALRDKYVQDIASGVAEDVARQRHQDSTTALLKQIPVTERNSVVVQDLVNRYGAIPPNVTTKVSTPGLDAAIAEMIDAHAIQVGLAAQPPWSKETIASEARSLRNIINGLPNSTAAFKATGGVIEGQSPSKTADDKLIWATSGEFMQPVPSVDYYGVDAMEAIRHRRIPRQVLRNAIDGYATGGFIGQRWFRQSLGEWPVNMPRVIPKIDLAALWKKWEAAQAAWTAAQSMGGDFGPGPGFPPWPSSPGAQRGDSGVWRSIVALIRSTGPLSGSFGNAYRAGDPLWHGSGRAVDWMGFNQDALAQFLAARRPLELIHRTASRDYAYTRGVNKGSFNNTLMNEHKNHVHIAMDDGGWLNPGMSHIWNGTGRPEAILTGDQWQQVGQFLQQSIRTGTGNNYEFHFLDTTLTPGKLRALQAREAVVARVGRAR